MNGNSFFASCREQIPTSLYRHPAWVARKETQGWYKTGDLDGQPILCRDIDSRTSMAYIVGAPQTEELDDNFGGYLEQKSLRALPFLPAKGNSEIISFQNILPYNTFACLHYKHFGFIFRCPR